VLSSVSRLMIDVVEESHLNLARRMTDVMALRPSEDMINIEPT
jgi:flagellar biosynthesis/type III secretory pathway ATPase